MLTNFPSCLHVALADETLRPGVSRKAGEVGGYHIDPEPRFDKSNRCFCGTNTNIQYIPCYAKRTYKHRLNLVSVTSDTSQTL
mmetsp:Transcript_16712/g.24221  ORF Transcript_16712/g.24221 Transcript_16712/m.24221 type:complete len:83 (+) Transcript_16712:798-1046(+)